MFSISRILLISSTTFSAIVFEYSSISIQTNFPNLVDRPVFTAIPVASEGISFVRKIFLFQFFIPGCFSYLLSGNT